MKKITIDILLTDFRQWAACVYMAESVKVLPSKYQEFIIVREWDMRTLEGVNRFREVKAKSLPSIVMDGEIVFASIIPGQEVLSKEILLRYNKKNLSRME